MNKNQMLLESIYLQNDLNLLQEGFGDVVRSFVADQNKMDNIISKIKSANNPETFKKVVSFIPKMDLKTTESIAKSKSSNYEKNKKVADKELDPDISDKFRNPLISMIALAGQDDNQIKTIARQINKQRVDWDTINAHLMFRLIISVVLTSMVAVTNPHVLPGYIIGLLIINIIRYLIDLAIYRVDDNNPIKY